MPRLPSMRWLRLRAVWLLVIPFFWLARPTPALLAAGAALAALGLIVRAWAAGVIHKDAELTTTGPYAFTRNPLYLGSLLLGLGVVTAGGRWGFALLFLAFFAWVYGRTMRGEAAFLEGRYGDRYRHYAASVPLFVPRLTAYRATAGELRPAHVGQPTGSEQPPFAGAHPLRAFSPERYLRHREWEALLGAAAGFAFLAAKMLLA